jgi:FkbM family methyltransferase
MLLWLKIILKEFSLFFRDSNYRVFAILATRYGGKKRNVPGFMTIAGKKIHTPDNLSVIWQYYEIFFKQYYRFTTIKNHSPRIIDIGSNVGLSLMFFSQEYPNANITAYEADPTIFAYLTENSTYFPTAELINKAVWLHGNGIELHSNGADSASILVGTGDTIHVSSISFKQILEAETEIDMLKMDIEGAENKVFVEAKSHLHKIKNIFLEYHSYKGEEQHLHEILTCLAENNFRYYFMDGVSKRAADKGSLDLQCNIIATRNT